jgi:hypothetical protein
MEAFTPSPSALSLPPEVLCGISSLTLPTLIEFAGIIVKTGRADYRPRPVKDQSNDNRAPFRGQKAIISSLTMEDQDHPPCSTHDPVG